MHIHVSKCASARVYTCAGVRSQHWAPSFLTLHLTFLRPVLSLNLELLSFAKPAD